MTGLVTDLSLALRDLRGGFRGIFVLIACLAIGVAAITAVGTTARSLADAMAREGRTILGGDIAFATTHREANREERAFLDRLGRVGTAATMRVMARTLDRADQTLAEVKAVDDLYPLAGDLMTTPRLPTSTLFARRDGAHGVVAEPALALRLGLSVGQRFTVGEATLELTAILDREPDRLAAGIGFGPRVLMSIEALGATRLLQPGSLVRWHYRAALANPTDGEVARARAEAQRLFPDAGWEIRSREAASPQLARNVERFTQFLTLVGLTALVVGGVGVANAARAHVEERTATIATLKALGATGTRVVLIFAVQTAMVAAIGIAAGLVLGTLIPVVASALFGHLFPIAVDPVTHWSVIALATAYGLLVTAAFAGGPLGRAHDVAVQALYRDRIAGEDRRRPRWRYLVAIVLAVAGLVGLALATASDTRLALAYVGAAAAAFLVLRATGIGIVALARRLPRPRATGPRLALANIHRPGAPTTSVVLSLGLGLTLLVALAQIDGNLRFQLSSSLPERSPSFFFIDVPSSDLDDFRDLLGREAPQARVETVPMLRGRIVAVKGTPVERYPVAPDAAWVLAGERGLTYQAAAPDASEIVDGRWWAADHDGPPLVSFDVRLARQLNLAVGDRLTVNVLGRNVEVTIANLRTVRWETIGINFVMVFSPNTFRGAPHTVLATLTMPGGAGAAEEVRLVRAVTDAFPGIASVRVKEALEAANGLLARLAQAVSGAASVTILAALLVLAGAMAAGQRARIYDAVILKTLGATRGRLVGTYVLEYGALGLVTALFALAVGTVAAWAVLRRVMDLPFTPMWSVAAAAILGALAITLALGLLGTWRALTRKPATVLRHL